ncbi:hypothetical protein RD792_009266 [Penstemon davidsonii]|uniref:AMP-dependent synthetase/ligase domain-containing protein n=1 Tax=Penstemon davidsonii TaxID=160366 RepID=A0ABR0CYK1_9LAMI|nr:hypothetical protein RD792_009266 [Penstemon davidsonii]
MKKFAVKVEQGKEGRDGQPSVGPVYRNLLSEHEYPPVDPNLSTAWEVFRASVEMYPENRMLGWRESVDGKVWGPYLWKSYKQVYHETLHTGSALRAHGIQPGARIGIYGTNCPQWIVAMEACSAHGFICVPLYDTLGPGAVNYIIDHAEIDVVFVQDKKVKELLDPECTHAQRLKLIICFTSLNEEQKNKTATMGIKPYSWSGFLNMGRENPSEILPPEPSNICTIMYTSGTSGDPKGVLKGLEELNWRRRKIFDMLYKNKLYWMTRGYKQKDASPLADLLAFRKVKNRLGGRLRLIVSGGAPLGREIEEFLRVTSCAFVVQGYGLTESCGLTTLGFPDDMDLIGTVGSPFVYSEIRLEEVPEMGYNPLGEPSCGEVCIKGKTGFAGYYKNPELTREVLTDGWFHTGDIGEMLPNGIVKIIDRKKNLVKTSLGEYVAVEYLEKVYGITPMVEDIWVYGDSFKSMLVAVVVPNEEAIKKWGHQNGQKESSFLGLCSLDKLKDHIIIELKLTAERNKLRGFEHIKGVIVEPQLFELSEKELVTATLKKRRDRLLKHYKVEIDALYQKLTKAAK